MAVDDPIVTYVGQKVLIEVEFRLNGVPRDPTIATLTYRSPIGTQATIQYPTLDFTRRSEGLYEASILVEDEGTWVFRAVGTGIVDSVNEYTVDVLPSGLDG
jgi:hypothetical protein